MNLELEKLVIEKFIVKTKCDRYLSFVKSEKNRKKFTFQLAHFHDLRLDLFDEITGNEWEIIEERIQSIRNIKYCFIISENSEIDQKIMDIETALNETIGKGMGTLIVFGNAEVVFYEGESPNNRWISNRIPSNQTQFHSFACKKVFTPLIQRTKRFKRGLKKLKKR